MHVAEVDVGCGICPVAGIDDREPHSLHIVGNLRVFHMLAFDKRLLYHNLEFTFCRTSKAEDNQACFREICVVKRDAVERKDGLDKIVEPMVLMSVAP